jgi:hypothetical protein
VDNRSEQAKSRAQLFESVVKRYEAVVLPGRYGGDYNNDQLAYSEANGKVTLFLGLKLLDSTGGLQLDAASLGPHMQYSESWLLALVRCLEVSSETIEYSIKIKEAMDSRTLVACVACMDTKSQEVKFLRIAV